MIPALESLAAERDALAAEVARLRAALERLSMRAPYDYPGDNRALLTCVEEWVRETAREALEETK